MEVMLDSPLFCEDDCVGILHESIETNLWQAEAYAIIQCSC